MPPLTWIASRYPRKAPDRLATSLQGRGRRLAAQLACWSDLARSLAERSGIDRGDAARRLVDAVRKKRLECSLVTNSSHDRIDATLSCRLTELLRAELGLPQPTPLPSRRIGHFVRKFNDMYDQCVMRGMRGALFWTERALVDTYTFERGGGPARGEPYRTVLHCEHAIPVNQIARGLWREAIDEAQPSRVDGRRLAIRLFKQILAVAVAPCEKPLIDGAARHRNDDAENAPLRRYGRKGISPVLFVPRNNDRAPEAIPLDLTPTQLVVLMCEVDWYAETLRLLGEPV